MTPDTPILESRRAALLARLEEHRTCGRLTPELVGRARRELAVGRLLRQDPDVIRRCCDEWVYLNGQAGSPFRCPGRPVLRLRLVRPTNRP